MKNRRSAPTVVVPRFIISSALLGTAPGGSCLESDVYCLGAKLMSSAQNVEYRIDDESRPRRQSGKTSGNLVHDFMASIVVFLVALPLCMGIAIASGVPVAAGLLSGIIGGVVVGVIGGAPLQVSGPAAGLSVLVY